MLVNKKTDNFSKFLVDKHVKMVYDMFTNKKKGANNMKRKESYKKLAPEAIDEGRQLNELFKSLSETGKMMAFSYISALRDKEASEAKAG